MEDRFDQILKLLNNGAEKNKQQQIGEGENSGGAVITNTGASSNQFQIQDPSTMEAQGNFLRAPKVDFPRFDGENPRAWAHKCSKFFQIHPIEENQKASLASLYLEGKADAWFLDYQEGKECIQWEELVEDICGRFELVGQDNCGGLF
ncbi:hypothetical protein IFM89_036385 [Coptis chinensis]|uniref:Retrotransposon gag protein n=1 Tax=Coptis chinensis TaxID=261450 RepID=A0A835M891_9MAGN|nr:hypothetical protein IFM89_036385 [Coptis chinensis]